MSQAPFAIFFNTKSCPVPSTSFVQADATHWVSDGRDSYTGSSRRARNGSTERRRRCLLPPFLILPGLSCMLAIPLLLQVFDATVSIVPDYHDLKEVRLMLLAVARSGHVHACPHMHSLPLRALPVA
jgi:hypothetical protein